MMLITRNMEIRHMKMAQVLTLAKLLDKNRLWEQLMEVIPKNLEDIDADDLTRLNAKIIRKYSREDMKTIERESELQRRSPSQILFEEWGTSGRIRPTIGHLLHLLQRVELYRAADYVAVDILCEPRPQRPSRGPAAVIDTAIPQEVLQREIESQLDHMHYPNTGSLNTNVPSQTINGNRDYPVKLNIDQCKVNLTPAQPSLTQSNNETNTVEQQLEQVTGDFERLLSNKRNTTTTTQTTNTNESLSEFGQEVILDSKMLPNFEMFHGQHNDSHSTHNVSDDTQSTEMSEESSEYKVSSNFIPVMVGENGLRSNNSLSNDSALQSNLIPTMISANGLRSNHTESTEFSIESDYGNSHFIPLTVPSSRANQSTTNNSNYDCSLGSHLIPATIGDNGLRSSNGISSAMTAENNNVNSSSALIPLSVMNENGHRPSEHIATS